jgi:hypothetical protein
MALESDSSSKDFTNTTKKDTFPDAKKDPTNRLDIDHEKGTPSSILGQGKKGGRIAPVLPHLRGKDFGVDESGDDLLGKQIELEANNTIQYRTCSWQKVRLFGAIFFLGALISLCFCWLYGR